MFLLVMTEQAKKKRNKQPIYDFVDEIFRSNALKGRYIYWN